MTKPNDIMKNLIQELEKYFETTPRGKVLEDWAATEEFDSAGITVEELLSNIDIQKE